MKTRNSKLGKTKWYLNDVKPKRNIVWTQKLRKEIYTLRKELPAREVAKKLNLTVIQIYNATRMYKRGLKSECFCCGNPLTKKEKAASRKRIKACFKCKKKAKEYKDSLRKKAKQKGICVYCLDRPARKGHNSCRRCVSATHRRRYLQGLCGQCGKKPINYPDESVCPSCAKKNRERAAEIRKRKKNE